MLEVPRKSKNKPEIFTQKDKNMTKNFLLGMKLLVFLWLRCYL
jgi:hypothetical protein